MSQSPTYTVSQRPDGSYGLLCEDGRIIGTAKTEAEAQFGVDVATWLEEKRGAPGGLASADAATVSPSVAGSPAGHTAGPWAFEDICFDRRIAINGGVTVYGRPFMVAWVNRPGSARAGEDKANARLIAAAPDLLAACLAQEDRHQRGGVNLTEAELMAIHTLRKLAISKALAHPTTERAEAAE